MTAALRRVLTPLTTARAAVGWLTVLVLWAVSDLLTPPVPAVPLLVALAVIVGVIIFASTGVVHQAEQLARRLGDPYGSLVLTLSIVMIEVVLICAVMLGPGEHPTIARDSVMAVSMIILNLVVGLCLLVGGLAHGHLQPNRTGVSTYLSLLVVLCMLAFGLPAALGTDGAFRPWQVIAVVAVTLGCYAVFLWRQTGAQAEDFTEVGGAAPVSSPVPGTSGSVRTGDDDAASRPPLGEVLRAHRPELPARLVVLVVSVLPVVLLSHDMAALLDDALGRAGAPPAVAGVLIAGIVFLPESITSLRAARAGRIQRASNLCHGALVSTVGLTIPAVLVIGLLTGQTVVLAESPANLLLLGVTLALSTVALAAPRVTAVHGAAHLVLFTAYGIVVFS
ncbi:MULTISPECIES: calcium:proton antiporter [Kocuria]|uniref:calcium:proton antiporter n=1 Tax=Kocuria TaxID=57493 RepID=UPI0011A1F89B|nr:MULTISPECIES: calcium:proton antiporter [Kocuria]MBS6029749.1 calcium:proton antiporter [Kocuria rhizophila]